MDKKLKNRLMKIILGAVVLIAVMVIRKVVNISPNMELAGFLAAYLILGGKVLKKAVRNILSGKVFNENFLMGVATLGAFFLGEYPEGVAVMLFYQVGEFFESYAEARSQRSISELMDICPESANRKTADGVEKILPKEIKVDDLLLIRPGEKIPVDGVVTEGSSALDTKALTGESLPREIGVGDHVISGCINQSGVLEVRALKEYENSTAARVLALVENAENKKAKSESFISRFARYYTPVVVITAALLAVGFPLLLQESWKDWIYTSLNFLVISCPCALVISVPLSFFGGIGGASKYGILVKGGNYLEALAHCETAVFDEPSKLLKAMAISRKTLRIVKFNIVFAITVKIVVLILALLHMATMWGAVFADVGVLVLAVLNAMRAGICKEEFL